MPVAPAEVGDRLAQMVADLFNSVIDQEEFETLYTALWIEATTGGTSIAEIGAQFSSVLGLWWTNQVQFSDYLTGDPDFNSPDPAQPELGWYPLTNHLGAVTWFPSPARMIQDFTGIQVAGTLDAPEDLPGSAPLGTIYIIEGHYWVRNASTWVDVGAFQGPQGAQGNQGNKGWSPICSLVADGTRYVLKIVDWAGGEGTKPAIDKFIGPLGLVDTAAEGINVRGPQGIQGIQGPQGIQGLTGQSYEPDAVGLIADRDDHDAEAEGFSYLATDEGLLYFRVGGSGWSAGVEFGKGDPGDPGEQGEKAWSPVYAIVVDGARRVFQVSDWIGGEGASPETGEYLGATGHVALVADAIDVRGPQGVKGDKGWSPVFSIVNDSTRRVLRVIDWVGGEGDKPATGSYVGATGLVALIADGVDVRGPQGPQGVIGPEGPTGTIDYSDELPMPIDTLIGDPGILDQASRADHVHPYPLTKVRREITTTAVLEDEDHGWRVAWNKASGALTLPNDLPDGFNCIVHIKHATGRPTFTAAGGASLHNADNNVVGRNQWSEISVSVISNTTGTNAEYLISGDLT